MARPFPPCDRTRHSFHDVATGVRLHVAEAGPEDGPPVVLQHGWPQHWWCWRGVIPTLAEAGFRVLAPDFRGSGWSDAPPHGYDKEQFASDTVALLDAMGIERTAFAGHDWGGWTGQLLALRAPERLTRLVLSNIAPVWAPPRSLRSLTNAWRFGYQAVGIPWLGPAVQRSPLMRKAYPGVPDDAAREFAAAIREPGRAEAGSSIYRTFVTQEVPSVMRGRYEGQRITVPTKVLHGTADPVIRPFMVEGFRDHVDDLDLEWVHGAGHFLMDEQPALVADRIAAFLR